MSTEQKIDPFIQGMQCSTTQNIVVNITGITALCTSFNTYYNAVASKLELAISLTNRSGENETRNVNNINQKKRKFTPKQTEKNQRRSLSFRKKKLFCTWVGSSFCWRAKTDSCPPLWMQKQNSLFSAASLDILIILTRPFLNNRAKLSLTFVLLMEHNLLQEMFTALSTVCTWSNFGWWPHH